MSEERSTYEVYGEPEDFNAIRVGLLQIDNEHMEFDVVLPGVVELSTEEGDASHFQVSFPRARTNEFVDLICEVMDAAGVGVFMYTEDMCGFGDYDGEEIFTEV